MRTQVNVAGDLTSEPGDEMLRGFLRGQRESVLAVVEGLSEEDWHRSVVPTGWTPVGMLAHLGGAEWYWFQSVVMGKQPKGAGDAAAGTPYDSAKVVFTADEPSAEIVAFYRRQCERSEAVLDATPLSARVLGEHRLGDFEPENVRWVVSHMIEETARHRGHLDIARELLDGATRLGQR